MRELEEKTSRDGDRQSKREKNADTTRKLSLLLFLQYKCILDRETEREIETDREKDRENADITCKLLGYLQ